MASDYARDVVGYGGKPPNPRWPNGCAPRAQLRPQLRGGVGALDRRRRRPVGSPCRRRGRGSSVPASATSQPKQASNTAAARVSGASRRRSMNARSRSRYSPARSRSNAIRRPPARSRSAATISAAMAGAGCRCSGSTRTRSASTSGCAIDSLEEDGRKPSARVVLPLWAERQHAPPPGRRGRVPLRLGRLQRRPALLDRGGGQAASHRALFALQQ